MLREGGGRGFHGRKVKRNPHCRVSAGIASQMMSGSNGPVLVYHGMFCDDRLFIIANYHVQH